MAATDLTWSLGPSESWIVRALFYVAEGLILGALSYAILVTGWFTGGVDPWLLVLGAGGVVLASHWIARYLKTLLPERSTVDIGGAGLTWLGRDWLDVRRWRWTMLVAAAAAGSLIAGRLRSPGWFVVNDAPLVLTTLIVAGAAAVLGYSLSTRGAIDPGSLVLTYPKLSWMGFGERGDIDLRCLKGVRRLTLGSRTLLWLSFVGGTPDRFTVQGLYVLPTEVVDRSWSAFQSGLSAPVRQTVTNQSYRKQIMSILVGFTAVVVVVLGGFSLLGVPSDVLVLMALALAMIGVAVLLIAFHVP